MKKLHLLFILPTIICSYSAIADTALPKLKPGAWEVSTDIPNLKSPMKLTHCVTPETQDKLIKLANEAHGSCEKAVVTQSGNTWTSTTNCNYQGTAAKIIATFVMEDDAHYSSVVQTDSAKMAQTIKSTGKYLGDCKSNNAQELQFGNGMKMDPKQLEAIAKAVAQGAQQHR